MVSLYNHLTSSEGKRNVAKGWEKAGVAGVVKGESALPPEDPFEEFDNVLQL